MKRKFLLLMIVSMLLTGCYDKTETEERLYVVLMGIDGRSIPESYDIYGDEGRYIVSVGEAKLESDIGDDSEDQKTVIVSGNTFSDIKQTADKYSDKEIYFGQLKAAVLGADIIKDSDKLAETVKPRSSVLFPKITLTHLIRSNYLRNLHGLVLAGRYFWVQNLGSSVREQSAV